MYAKFGKGIKAAEQFAIDRGWDSLKHLLFDLDIDRDQADELYWEKDDWGNLPPETSSEQALVAIVVCDQLYTSQTEGQVDPAGALYLNDEQYEAVL